jgi:putrescine aminotransferase
MSTVDSSALRSDYALLVSRSAVERLAALGHDFIEVGGEGVHLFDESGRRILDCYSGGGVFNLGRRPQAIATALRRGLTLTDQGNFPLISVEKARTAARLSRFVPGPAECMIFGVGRGETFDAACKLARGFTKKPDLVAPLGSWFGETGFAISLSAHAHRDDFGRLVPQCRIEPLATPADVARAVTRETAAVLIEPMQAENHCATMSEATMSALVERCRAMGALLAVDETQTGFGRTGRRFAFEHFGLEPEIVVLGEALGAGMFPICGTLVSQRVNAFMNAHPLIHLSTFGGSDLGCVVALAALEEYERLRPWENAARQGARIRDALGRIKGRDATAFRSIAGKGLLVSLELSDGHAATRFCRGLAEGGVFAKPGKVATHSVVLRPPLTIDDVDVDVLLDAVTRASTR